MNGKCVNNKLSNGGLGTRPTLQKKSTTPSIAGKTKTKPSANTKSFLAEMRKKKTMVQDQNEDLFFVNGNGIASEHKTENHSSSS